MADTEVAVEPQAERGERRDDGPIVYDESLLIMVKGKVVQPKQPDHTESRLLIQKLQAEITKRGDRIKEIKSIEEQLRGQQKGAYSGNKDVITALKALRDQRATVIRQKAAIRDELHNSDGAREAIRAEMRSIRDKNRNVNIEKIEEELRQLEFKLQHETLPEQEEKRAQTQVQALTAARPLAKKYAEYDARLKEGDATRASIIARLKEADGVIAGLDQQIAAQSAVLDEAKSKADAHTADLPTLQVEKKENYEIMVTLRAKIDELRKANDAEYQEYIKRDRAFRGWKRAEGRRKYEERQKDREERDRQRTDEDKVAMGDIVVEPFSNEIFTCEQLLGYLRSLVGGAKEEVKEEAKPVEVPAGLKPFKRVVVEDEMFSGVPKKAQQPKGKAAAAAPAPVKAAEPAKPKVTKLNHMLDMLKVFLQLQVEPPTTTAGVPATIEKVETRLKEFKEKQEVAKRAPPPKPAAPEPAANGSHEPEAAAEAEPEAPAEPEAEAEAPAEAAPAEAPSAAPAAEPAAEEPAASSSGAAEEKPAEEKPAAGKKGKKGKGAAKEEEPALAAAKEEPAAASNGAASGTGVDFKLKVDGDKVAVTVRAA